MRMTYFLAQNIRRAPKLADNIESDLGRPVREKQIRSTPIPARFGAIRHKINGNIGY